MKDWRVVVKKTQLRHDMSESNFQTRDFMKFIEFFSRNIAGGKKDFNYVIECRRAIFRRGIL
jgi:hypothetical protein